MRVFTLIISVIASTSMSLAGCAKSEPGAEGGSSPSPQTTQAATGTGVDRPVLRVFLSDQALAVPAQMARYEQYMEEKAGVSLDITYLPHAQYLEQLQLKFAGGDFPDMYQTWSGPTPDLITGDKVLALNELIDRHGPNLKKAIPQSAWDAVTVQGQIYAIPQPTDTRQGSVMYIRKDWLDKLDLKVPETSDELLQVMRAFRDDDPNGNGQPDEIPFTMREKLDWGENIFGMWGLNSRYSEIYEDDKLVLGSVHPRFLQGLDYLRTMYAEKLLDRDFLVNTLSVWDQKISAGLVGIWNHTPRSAWRWQKALEDSIPDQKPEVIVIPTPRGMDYNGPVGTRWGIVSKTFILMKDAADPAAVIRWLDWLYSDEGRAFTEYGIEGETFLQENNRHVVLPGKEADIDFLQKSIAVHGISAEASSAILNDERAVEKLRMAYEIANAQGFVSETIGMPSIENDYNLHSMLVEEAALVIIGRQPLDAYSEFIEGWKNNGGNQFIEERTALYREHRLNESDTIPTSD